MTDDRSAPDNGRIDGARHLSDRYETAYLDLLAGLAEATRVEPPVLTAFWPMVGNRFAGELMVVGKAVNGWVDHIKVTDLGNADRCRELVQATRATSEGDGPCPMRWVTEMWGNPGGYSTARSAFWRHVRGVLSDVSPTSTDDPAWSSRVAWSNAAKLAPADGGNPGGALLGIQRRLAPRLLSIEIDELRPRRVLVLTGRWWFEPFADALGLEVDWRDGLVEGVAVPGETKWVIAKHPQGKPRSIRKEVVAAFESLEDLYD